MAYLSLTRFTGDPEALIASYTRWEPTMTEVGRDHGLLVHTAARTDAGLLARRFATLGSPRNRSNASTTWSTVTCCSPLPSRGARIRR